MPVKNDTVTDICINIYMAQNMGYGIGLGNSPFLRMPVIKILFKNISLLILFVCSRYGYATFWWRNLFIVKTSRYHWKTSTKVGKIYKKI